MTDEVVALLSELVRLQLNDRQGKTIEALLATELFGRLPKNDRLFVEAVLWWRRTSVPWRDLPPTFGPWKTVFNPFFMQPPWPQDEGTSIVHTHGGMV
jgi:transposase